LHVATDVIIENYANRGPVAESVEISIEEEENILSETRLWMKENGLISGFENYEIVYDGTSVAIVDLADYCI